MSLHLLVTGSLIADLVRRTSQAGKVFATAQIRCATDDHNILVSLIAFGNTAESLLAHRRGGRARCRGAGTLNDVERQARR